MSGIGRGVAMSGARPFLYSAMLLGCLLVSGESLLAQNEALPLTPLPQLSATPATASLRVSLRLQDESPFLGIASGRILRNGGPDIPATAEADGVMVFHDLLPGAYVLETNAPGFVPVKQNLQIEAASPFLTRFVVLEPKPVKPQPAEESGELPPASRASWIPLRIDQFVPPVDPSTECPLPSILNGAAQRTKQFISNLERFTATERVEHSIVDALGTRRKPVVRKFDYVVMVSRSPSGGFQLDEYRDRTRDPWQFPAHIATQGLPGMALLFHPLLASDFQFTCEGLGESAGHPAWQIYFVQRPDRPGRLLAYSASGRYISAALKGRAWLDPGTFQVLQLETDLMHPLREIGLTQEHVSISYEPVHFRSHDTNLWLPHTAELYVERHKHRYYRRHLFNHFQLFNVDTNENVQLTDEGYGFTNDTDRDISGILTVNPVSGAKLDPVTVSLTIPARGSVSKLVGPGKDVAIPVELVGSATFAHNGPRDAIHVAAHLSKESTLDVISGAPTPLKP
jgi:hypothetical protein